MIDFSPLSSIVREAAATEVECASHTHRNDQDAREFEGTATCLLISALNSDRESAV
jgi:hypothetical protein